MDRNYREALQYLYSVTDYATRGRSPHSSDRFDLERVERLLALIGNPHHTFRAIHVAGTKGKGSTSAMLASIARQAGYRTGLYTSPHLHSFRERMQVDGELISREEVVAGVKQLSRYVSQMQHVTTFELITTLAFGWFAAQRCELAVIEVGMGGRLDATNVITPMVSAITSISHDHERYLGHTLADIATEKAGIVKVGVPVVSAPQSTEVQQVITRICEERHSPLTIVGRDWEWAVIQSTANGQQFAAWRSDELSTRSVYTLRLLGSHQQANAVTALATVFALSRAGLSLPEHAIQEGLKSVQWPARLEVLSHDPWVVVDGAHNGDSMQHLRRAVEELFPHRKLILVFGASSDKDLDAMLGEILPLADRVLLTRAHHPRAADPATLASRAAELGKPAKTVAIEEALGEALRLANRDDLICATGSLFIAAEFRLAWLKHTHQPLPPVDEA
jgi:dihydrofolate synthase/folylpolyglutamate synthase